MGHEWKGQRPTTYADYCLDRIATALEVWVMGLQTAKQEPAAEPGTPLPEDFPGLIELHEAGIVYLERLPRKGSELAGLGLDAPTINRILTRLKADGA